LSKENKSSKGQGGIMPYNLLSCSGWEETGVASFLGSTSCIKARIGVVILFFLIAIIRKWGGEEVGMEFSFALALIGGLLPYFLIVIIFGSFKIALVAGILGALVLGYGAGYFFGGSSDGY
jgi:hypothetical protein